MSAPYVASSKPVPPSATSSGSLPSLAERPRLKVANLLDALREIAAPEGTPLAYETSAPGYLHRRIDRLKEIAARTLEGLPDSTDAHRLRTSLETARRTIGQLREGRALSRARIKGLELQRRHLVAEREKLRDMLVAAHRDRGALDLWLADRVDASDASVFRAYMAVLVEAIKAGDHLAWAVKREHMVPLTRQAVELVRLAAMPIRTS